jgi:glycerate-2-kinase
VKKTAEHVFRHTLAAIDIPSALARRLDRRGSLISAGGADVDLREFREIVAIAFGKAANTMALGLTEVLTPEFPPDGVLVVPVPRLRPLPGWQTFVGGHPLPTAQSFAAGKAILERLARCDTGIFSDFWGRVLVGGATAGAWRDAGGFSGAEFRTDHLWRADRGN